MQSISATFTAAARGKSASTGFSFFWMMVLAIAILDDSASRKNAHRPVKPQP